MASARWLSCGLSWMAHSSLISAGVRSRTPSEYRFSVFMHQSSRRLELPGKSQRFKPRHVC